MRLMNWNIEHMNSWWEGGNANPPVMRDTFVGNAFSPAITDVPALATRAGEVVKAVDPDVIAIQEGPGIPEMRHFLTGFVGGTWEVLRGAGGAQALLVAVRQGRGVTDFTPSATSVGDIDIAGPFTADVDADLQLDEVDFARIPQVVGFKAHGQPFVLINNHLKSKFVNQGEALFNAGGEDRLLFFAEALKARRRISGEAYRLRAFMDAMLANDPAANIVVCGDLNDGPGSDFFEANFLTHSVVDRVFGSIFHVERQLTHVLLHGDSTDYTAKFFDFIDKRLNELVIDHIGLSRGITGRFSWQGRVPVAEYEAQVVDDLSLNERDRAPSDHRPVVVELTPLD
ncbi:endonuclease/exonuclease/phosphatase family protein [Pelagibacterium halotolerans]|uniref:endonuclease/exonuclease/phosphatase family protein n=1 Tax=Pelagibacterium halotolerans TaxID=531813 RepID=UPI00384F805A